MKYKNAVPVIATTDVRSTIDYYVGTLGFREHFIYGDPPVYAGVKRDDVLLYISRDSEFAAVMNDRGLHPDIFLWVQNVDDVFQEHKQQGAKIVEDISDRPWDARQYVVEDLNGYHLKIAEPIDEIKS